MKADRPLLAPVSHPPRGPVFAAAAFIVVAVLVAYHNSFSGVFVFDDLAGIVENRSIRQLWPLGPVLSPPHTAGTTVGGRPVVNLSLALNHALGGTDVRGYHAFNLSVHVIAALVLFGLVRRTLLQPTLSERFGGASTWLAAAVALLWAVHPLHTESVTYVIQRAESLMGLLYLLTLYCFVRGVHCHLLNDNARSGGGRGRGRWWRGAAVVSCVLGMATKEVMATAPLLVLLYDRTFLAGSFRAAWTQRWKIHTALAATWLVLGALVLGTDNRGGTAGLGAGDSPWTYALTQVGVVTHYLALAFWPQPLVFDYGTRLAGGVSDLAFPALVLLPLLAATVLALWRRPAMGFLGAWFFAILAPSSSIVPIAVQPMAEHRLYLPLAAVIAGGVLAMFSRVGRGSFVLFSVVAVALGWLTVQRNDVYRSELVFWADAAAKRPDNPRALCNYADALLAADRPEAALVHYERAAALERPAAARGERSLLGEILINTGNALLATGRASEAIARYEEALRFDPSLVKAHYDLGCVLMENPARLADAAARFEAALRLDPDYVSAHTNLASVCLRQGRVADALRHYETTLRLDPDSANAEANLGNALLRAGRVPEATAHLERAVRLKPGFAVALQFLGEALARADRGPEAILRYEEALRLNPDDAELRRILLRLHSRPSALRP